MLESPHSLDIEAIVDHVRSLWREALSRESTARVELFAKVALRVRVTRDIAGTRTTFDHARESGLAVRLLRAEHEHAGFAAASGLDSDAIRWAAASAGSFRSKASASTPASTDAVAAERWDLDAPLSLPSEEALSTALVTRPALKWVEAGTTIEVLVGPDGWLAARRRHRLWALGGVPEGRLYAQRGLTGWENLLDRPGVEDELVSRPDSDDLGVLILTPDAAAPVVAALVDAFHGPGSAQFDEQAGGWSISDEPVRQDGLAGGSFDDAGFPATSRVLADKGAYRDRLGGPGTFRRTSFREPPTEIATNLVMAPGEPVSNATPGSVAIRCRVLPLAPQLWVLELDLADQDHSRDPMRRWIRVQPRELLAACAGGLGGLRVTATGPIVPALKFVGLATRDPSRASADE